jgi:putative transposase
MLLNQKYEIFPNEKQKKMLDRWLQYCRQTYNSALLDKQRKYRESKESYYRKDMQTQLKMDKKKYPFLKEVPSQPLQEVLLRLEKAFDGFFRKDKNYPKQKKYKDYTSMTFPQFGFNAKGNRMAMSFSDNGKLYNTKLGEIDFLLHRPLEGIIRQLVIKRDWPSSRFRLPRFNKEQRTPSNIGYLMLIGAKNKPPFLKKFVQKSGLKRRLARIHSSTNYLWGDFNV